MKTYEPPKKVTILTVNGLNSKQVELIKYDDNGIVYIEKGLKVFIPYQQIEYVKEIKWKQY